MFEAALSTVFPNSPSTCSSVFKKSGGNLISLLGIFLGANAKQSLAESSNASGTERNELAVMECHPYHNVVVEE